MTRSLYSFLGSSLGISSRQLLPSSLCGVLARGPACDPPTPAKPGSKPKPKRGIGARRGKTKSDMASQVDWERIEAEYRAAQLSVSEIGRLCGVSHTAINKRAKREGWTRDLAAKVRQEVSARLVSEGVSAANARETVQLAAERDVQLIRQHRNDIASGRAAVNGLFAELMLASEKRDDIEDAIEEETKNDANGQRRAHMLKAVSLASRSSVASNLAVALKNLVTIERQAFGLKNESPDGDKSGDETTRIVFVDAGPSGS